MNVINSNVQIYPDFYVDDGSENAPEDSGFLSDDGEHNERIVNESSLYEEGDQASDADSQFAQTQQLNLQLENEGFGDANLLFSNFHNDDQMIMTGRSESAMDE